MNILENKNVKAENIIYINKELVDFDNIKTYLDLNKYVKERINDKRVNRYLFIDEIQEIEQWEKAIASLLAEKKIDIYITGSNARLLSSELATLLSGRYIEIKMHTFSFKEFKETQSEFPDQQIIDDFIDSFSAEELQEQAKNIFGSVMELVKCKFI